MCLIVFAYRIHPDYPVIMAANRDEFYERPTHALAHWQDGSGIVAGRDLEGGGTWMGAHAKGGLAALTNFRDPDSLRANTPSRGHLVTDFLKGPTTLNDYLKKIEFNAHRYNGFNILLSNGSRWAYYSNRGGAPRTLAPGIHGLSNHLINTPWPKVTRSCQALENLLNPGRVPRMDAIMEILQDREVPADEALPRTGIGMEWERLLGSVFIHSDVYGTRSSTVLMVASDGRARIRERTFDRGGITGEIECKLHFPGMETAVTR